MFEQHIGIEHIPLPRAQKYLEKEQIFGFNPFPDPRGGAYSPIKNTSFSELKKNILFISFFFLILQLKITQKIFF